MARRGADGTFTPKGVANWCHMLGVGKSSALDLPSWEMHADAPIRDEKSTASGTFSVGALLEVGRNLVDVSPAASAGVSTTRPSWSAVAFCYKRACTYVAATGHHIERQHPKNTWFFGICPTPSTPRRHQPNLGRSRLSLCSVTNSIPCSMRKSLTVLKKDIQAAAA